MDRTKKKHGPGTARPLPDAGFQGPLAVFPHPSRGSLCGCWSHRQCSVTDQLPGSETLHQTLPEDPCETQRLHANPALRPPFSSVTLSTAHRLERIGKQSFKSNLKFLLRKDVDFNPLSRRLTFLPWRAPICRMSQALNRAHIIFDWGRRSSDSILAMLLLNAT